METEIRPSEKLKGFIQFLEDTKESYESAKRNLENTIPKKGISTGLISLNLPITEMSETDWLQSIIMRDWKDVNIKISAISTSLFMSLSTQRTTKSTLKRLKGAIQRQEKQEDYLESERTYKRGDSGDTD